MTGPGPSRDDVADDTTRRGPRRVARRTAQALYYGFVVFVAASAVWQITAQIWFSPAPTASPPFDGCEAGLRAFYDSIAQGRAAARLTPAGGDTSAEAALVRYRAALAPLWRYRETVATMCAGTSREGLLDAIERLRYSEEHAVRHQAHELTALRRRVSNAVAEQLPPASDELPSPSSADPAAADDERR